MVRNGTTQRALVMSKNGMVATGHPLATAAGIDALRRGGNAMDAAIAAALATGVVMPAMNGLGGDAFILYYEAKSGNVTAINGSGIAPRKADAEYFLERNHEKMPFYGPLSVAVPGAVDAYFTAINRFCRLDRADLFRHAIQYADEGFPLTHGGSRIIAGSAEHLGEYETSARIFLRGGNAPAPGTIFRQTDLARSLRTVEAGGPDVFYRGEIAQSIGAYMQKIGGLLSADDFADHESVVYSPISADYRGHTVYETTLPSQGLIVLEELNIIANADMAALGLNSTDAIHTMVEAKKLAYADRLAYAGDPKFVDVPLDTILSKEFARRRFAEIDMAHAKDQVGAGLIPEHVGDTTYLCTMDGEGNAVSLITSLSAGFGSQVVAGDTGIMLNNRAGRGFTLEEGHPNVIEGGKKTMHTLNCYLITHGGEIRWVGGTPGGDGQPQWNMQVITNLIDYGLNEQEAVEAPRWMSFPGTDPINLPNDYVVRIEGRVGEDVLAGLKARGHEVTVLDDWAAGGDALVIGRNAETGVLSGGGDARTESVVTGI
ncbi:MAG TPA: gamma-glutamyltransferase [Nitrolancea sp.]